MGKLHEIVAVEPDLRASTDAILNETKTTFEKRDQHFTGQTRRFQPKSDDGEVYPPEDKPLVDTVPSKLSHMEKHVVRLLDATYQKEVANTAAKADLVINGITVAKDIPAAVLLNFENKLKHIKQVYMSIPTLDPSEEWKEDPNEKNIYRSELKITTKTSKVQKPLVLYQATDKHPAQTQLVVSDEVVGHWHTTYRSGKITPRDKSELLERLDNLITSVKRARCKANEVEAPNIEIGAALFQYINTGTVAQA